MGIQEVTPKHNPESINKEVENPHRVWELGVLGNKLVFERYGSLVFVDGQNLN